MDVGLRGCRGRGLHEVTVFEVLDEFLVFLICPGRTVVKDEDEDVVAVIGWC